MNRIFRRALLAASSLGMAGGIVLTALPASAAIDVTAYGAAASGPIHFPPVAWAAPFDTPSAASNANYGNVLVTGRIVDRASPTTGYSLVNSPIVQYGLVKGQADQLSSWCHIGDSATFGGASIFNGSISVNGSIVYLIPRYPAPNTTVTIGGATITFNEQIVVAGHLQVSAVHLVDGSQNLWLGVTSCEDVDL